MRATSSGEIVVPPAVVPGTNAHNGLGVQTFEALVEEANYKVVSEEVVAKKADCRLLLVLRELISWQTLCQNKDYEDKPIAATLRACAT